MTRAFMVAGAASGTGKTTFTTGLIAALRRRGQAVQPFKAGPDYLDPTYHSLAAGPGFAARNLDTWLLPPENLRELFERATGGADFAVIEGVMGLFDGKNGQSEEGSSAGLAKLLGVPVLAVLDIGKMSRTAGAIALGLKLFDPSLNLAGFLLNNAGSETHYHWCREAVETATGLPVLGWLPKNIEWILPERHLGLVPAGEGGGLEQEKLQQSLEKLADRLTGTVDLDRIEKIAVTLNPLNGVVSGLFPESPAREGFTPPAFSKREKPVKIGLARDEAFGFYYQDNLDLLAAWGAEIIPFSPLNDKVLPPGLAGIYIGGGFPEIFAGRLAANEVMRRAIFEANRNGLPVYAECGGLMYLGRDLMDFEGQVFPMVGLLPFKTAMQNRRVKLGYAEIFATEGHPFLPPGQPVRAHEFHWSNPVGEGPAEIAAAYRVPAQANRLEGWKQENLLASYFHLHFGSNPGLAPGLLNWFSGPRPQKEY